MFFFAVPFPMILYYNIKSESDIAGLADQNPWLALGILALSLVLWGIVLTGFFRTWVLSSFIAKRNVDRLLKHGIEREAKILSAEKVSKEGATYSTYHLSLSFKNLVNTEIVQKTAVNDARPHEHRFEAGKRVNILIDGDMKSIPYLIFSGSEAGIHIPIISLIILGWLAVAAVVAGYYVFSYTLESYGMGWRFIGFLHPLTLCPLILLGYRLLGKLLSNFTGEPEDVALIKFKGVRTNAKLLSANQTGTYINEQPMVRFELEFTDERQQKHKTSLKKIVDLLHLDITRQETIDIFYLKNNPQQVAFARDLEDIS